MSWIQPTVTLCTYGFFKEMKPSEAFLTLYLKGPDKNISKKALTDEIYPVSTYSYLVFLFVVLLTTDVLRYKPMIITESFAYLSTRVLLIWGKGILTMQIMQVTYGLATATEIAYYSYIYAIVSEEYYRKVTSYTRMFVLFGKGVGDLLGQILISTKTLNYLQLNYVSFASVTVAFIVTLFLPKVPGSIMNFDEKSANSFRKFSNEVDVEQTDEENDLTTSQEGSNSRVKTYFSKLFQMFRNSYKNTGLLKWSIWWALAMCGGLQVEDYVMNLWSNLQGTSDVYNGAVFAIGTLLGALCVFLFSILKVDWGVFSELAIGVISILDCVVLLTTAYTSNIWLAYACYIIFRALYAFALTIASYQIAVDIQVRGYGLIFGWNTLMALCFQSILTAIVVDKKGLDLNEEKQFVIYGWYHAFIALIFLARPTYVLFKKVLQCCRRSRTDNPI